MLSQRITSVPGASKIFSYGICSYSEAVKEKELGVKRETLSEFGVYSKECALEMARGARKNASASIGIGITGIAGPDGGTEIDPVGTVYIAVVSERKEEVVRTVLGTGRTERALICRFATSKAISMALSLIK
jgi:PncC family amidohydrolase